MLTFRRLRAGMPPISDVKCGNNHTAAVTDDGKVFTWGFGGYGRLGHNQPQDELAPREVSQFSEGQRRKAGGPLGPPDGAVGITCGAACTLVVRMSGKVMFFGKTKTSGEATMCALATAHIVRSVRMHELMTALQVPEAHRRSHGLASTGNRRRKLQHSYCC